MHEAFSGSLESAPSSAELLEVTPVSHEVFPIDSVKQRTLRGGAVPLASVGQEAQVITTGESDVDQMIAQRAMTAAGAIADQRAHTVGKELQHAA